MIIDTNTLVRKEEIRAATEKMRCRGLRIPEEDRHLLKTQRVSPRNYSRRGTGILYTDYWQYR